MSVPAAPACFTACGVVYPVFLPGVIGSTCWAKIGTFVFSVKWWICVVCGATAMHIPVFRLTFSACFANFIASFGFVVCG